MSESGAADSGRALVKKALTIRGVSRMRPAPSRFWAFHERIFA
jgi:hypothetical protein